MLRAGSAKKLVELAVELVTASELIMPVIRMNLSFVHRLMFRPDGTGMNAGNLKGTHLVPEYPHSQPDVVDFTRHALNHGYGAEELGKK